VGSTICFGRTISTSLSLLCTSGLSSWMGSEGRDVNEGVGGISCSKLWFCSTTFSNNSVAVGIFSQDEKSNTLARKKMVLLFIITIFTLGFVF